MHNALKTLLVGMTYPLLAHAAAVTGSNALAVTAVGVLVLLPLLPGLSTGRPGAWVALGAIVLVLAWLASHGAATLPLYAPPVLITATMAWFFGRTLREGRIPLIERVALAMNPPGELLDARVRSYARSLTAAWAVLLGTLAAINLVLAALAEPAGLLLSAGLHPPVTVPRSWWSAFANLLNYVIIAGFFAVEYAWRHRVFRDLPYRSFGDFVRRVAALGPRFWRDPQA